MRMNCMVIKTVDILGDVEELVIPFPNYNDDLPEAAYEFGENGFSAVDFLNPDIYTSVSISLENR